MSRFKFHTLDVFTDRRFAGNPLAVVLDADGLSTEAMAAVTREFNLSETSFVMKPADAANTARVRIFCPGSEMPFAGHPTLGTAILLAELARKPGCSFETEIRLEENAGLVPVKVGRIGPVSRGMFTAPVIPFAVETSLPSPELAAWALGLSTADVGFDAHAIAVYEGGPRFLYVPLAGRPALERARASEPHWSEMTRAAGVDSAYIYTRGGDGEAASFRARMFAPEAGVPEDPATGSATALLAAQLIKAEALGAGSHRFQLEQGYEMGRPSDLTLEIDVEARALNAVRVGGSAVRMFQGEIEV